MLHGYADLLKFFVEIAENGRKGVANALIVHGRTLARLERARFFRRVRLRPAKAAYATLLAQQAQAEALVQHAHENLRQLEGADGWTRDDIETRLRQLNRFKDYPAEAIRGLLAMGSFGGVFLAVLGFGQRFPRLVEEAIWELEHFPLLPDPNPKEDDAPGWASIEP